MSRKKSIYSSSDESYLWTDEHVEYTIEKSNVIEKRNRKKNDKEKRNKHRSSGKSSNRENRKVFSHDD